MENMKQHHVPPQREAWAETGGQMDRAPSLASHETTLAMVAAREKGRPPLVVGGTEGLLNGGAVAVDELGES